MQDLSLNQGNTHSSACRSSLIQAPPGAPLSTLLPCVPLNLFSLQPRIIRVGTDASVEENTKLIPSYRESQRREQNIGTNNSIFFTFHSQRATKNTTDGLRPREEPDLVPILLPRHVPSA